MTILQLKPVVFNWRKWDSSPHWTHHAFFLGEDEHGLWFGQRAGVESSRPGMAYVTETDTLMLVSHDGNWVAKFFPDGRDDGLLLYVDLAYDMQWDSEKSQVTGIDMDLDVIKTDGGKNIWVEDVQEFHENKVLYNYPEWIISKTWDKAFEIEEKVISPSPLFGGYEKKWFTFFSLHQALSPLA